MNDTDSSPENWRASSSASSITTGGRRFQIGHLVNRQPQNIAVHDRHPLQPPVLRLLGMMLVDVADILGRAAHQRFHELIRAVRLRIILFRAQAFRRTTRSRRR